MQSCVHSTAEFAACQPRSVLHPYTTASAANLYPATDVMREALPCLAAPLALRTQLARRSAWKNGRSTSRPFQSDFADFRGCREVWKSLDLS